MKATIYDKKTGALLRTFEGPADMLALQLGGDEEAHHDLLPLASSKIDVASGKPVHFIPASPPDYEWDADRQQHRLTAVGREKEQARVEIKLLEDSQSRALREFALGDKSAEAKLRLIDDKIQGHRKKL